MSTYTQLIYHIVFSTKHQEGTLIKNHRRRLFAYIHQLLTTKTAIYIGSMAWKITFIF